MVTPKQGNEPLSLHMYLFLGPCGKQLPGSVCPLGMDHPPTGEEFVIDCAMCINTHSF